jgi:hypothetical protein
MSHSRWIRQTDRGEAACADQVSHAPDYVRHDRGDVDDHWARVFGALCVRCGQLIEETDYARRRADDEWVHEHCTGRSAALAPGPAAAG